MNLKLLLIGLIASVLGDHRGFATFPLPDGTDSSSLPPNVVLDTEYRTVEQQPSMDAEPGGRIWGQPVRGLEMSIATAKGSYASGEPIVASLWLRNRTTNEFTTVDWTDYENMFDLIINLEGKGLLPDLRKSDPLIAMSATAWQRDSYIWTLKPGHERCYKLQLNQSFDMSEAGTYIVTAIRKQGFPGSTEPVEIRSENAVIEVGTSRYAPTNSGRLSSSDFDAGIRLVPCPHPDQFTQRPARSVGPGVGTRPPARPRELHDVAIPKMKIEEGQNAPKQVAVVAPVATGSESSKLFLVFGMFAGICLYLLHCARRGKVKGNWRRQN